MKLKLRIAKVLIWKAKDIVRFQEMNVKEGIIENIN